MNKSINGNIIKQILLIIVILCLASVIIFNLSMFIPSLLAAITLYIIFRNLNIYLIEKRGWKSWISSLSIILIIFIVIVLPTYFSIDFLISKAKNTTELLNNIYQIIDKIHTFVLEKMSIDLLSNENLDALKNNIGTYGSKALSTTVNTASVIGSTFFILYFMLEKPRRFEKIIADTMPFKAENNKKLGKKTRNMVIANAVGIPVVALGQGLVALIGYFIFGVQNPIVLFILTVITAMIPIVGSMLVYIPICLFMLAEGRTYEGVGLLIYCFIFVGLVDNVMRFTFLKKMENIHPLNTVFGIIVGMNLFGFMGLIFGPILVSLTLLLIKIYSDEFTPAKDTTIEKSSTNTIDNDES